MKTARQLVIDRLTRLEGIHNRGGRIKDTVMLRAFLSAVT